MIHSDWVPEHISVTDKGVGLTSRYPHNGWPLQCPEATKSTQNIVPTKTLYWLAFSESCNLYSKTRIAIKNTGISNFYSIFFCRLHISLNAGCPCKGFNRHRSELWIDGRPAWMGGMLVSGMNASFEQILGWSMVFARHQLVAVRLAVYYTQSDATVST